MERHSAVNDEQRQILDEPPPVLGSWPRVYLFVVCYLAALITLFYLFTAHFAP
jgi:hypothetical protein